jgi:hypothetical protein
MLITLLTVLSLLACSERISGHKKKNLKGNIKNIKDIIFEAVRDGDSIIKTEKIISQDIFFNKKGYNTEIISYMSDSIHSKNVFQYDWLNGDVVDVYYDGSNDVLVKTVWKYNKAGNPLCLTIYDTNEEKVGEGQYEYNAQGLLQKFKSFGDFDEMYKDESYFYDENKLLISTLKTNLNGEVFKHYFKYDSMLNPILVEIYNKNSILVETVEYTYKYDTIGNWIERIEKKNGEPFEYVTREITYY